MERSVQIAVTMVRPDKAKALFDESITGKITKLEQNLKKNVWKSGFVSNPQETIGKLIEEGENTCVLQISKFSSADEMLSLLRFLNLSTHETFVSVSVAQSDGSLFVLIADKKLSKRLRREFPGNEPLMEEFGPPIN